MAFQKTSNNTVFRERKGSSLVIYVDSHRIQMEFPYPRCFSSGGVKPPTIGDSARTSATPSRSSSVNLGQVGSDAAAAASGASTGGDQVSDITTRVRVSDKEVPSNMYNTCFRGQMGAVYFFSDELNDTQVSSIRGLGYDYSYCFEPNITEYDSTGMFVG